MKIKIRNCYHEKDEIDYKQWEVKGEDRRVDIHFNQKCFSFVLNNKNPKVEVWSIDANSELDKYLYDVSLLDTNSESLLTLLESKK